MRLDRCTLENEWSLFGFAIRLSICDDKPFYTLPRKMYRWYFLHILLGKTIHSFCLRGKFLGEAEALGKHYRNK